MSSTDDEDDGALERILALNSRLLSVALSNRNYDLAQTMLSGSPLGSICSAGDGDWVVVLATRDAAVELLAWVDEQVEGRAKAGKEAGYRVNARTKKDVEEDERRGGSIR